MKKYSRAWIGRRFVSEEGEKVVVIDGGSKVKYCTIRFFSDGEIRELQTQVLKRGVFRKNQRVFWNSEKIKLWLKGNKPKYTLLEFSGTSKKKSTFFCEEHGIFNMVFTDLKGGHNCKKCGYKKNSYNFSCKEKDVVGWLRENSKYTLFEYSGKAQTNSKFMCDKHGVFSKRFSHIKQGEGCPKCYEERRGETIKKTHDDFVKELKSYDDNIEVLGRYSNNRTKIKFRYKDSGKMFESTPDFLLRTVSGKGKEYNLNKKHEAQSELIEAIENGSFEYKKGDNVCFLYVLKTDIDGLFKVGVANAPQRRIIELNREGKMKHELLYFIPFNDDDEINAKRKSIKVEQVVHELLEEYNHTFDTEFGGSTEYFKCDLDVILEAIEITGIEGLAEYTEEV